MAADIRFSAEECEVVLAELVARGKDMKAVMVPVAVKLQGIVLRNLIAQDGGPFGGWPGLTPETIEKREREGYGASPMLLNTGRGRASILKKASKHTAAGGLPGGAIDGWYLRTANSGLGRKGRQEQRGFVWMNAQDEVEIEDMVFNFWLGDVAA